MGFGDFDKKVHIFIKGTFVTKIVLHLFGISNNLRTSVPFYNFLKTNEIKDRVNQCPFTSLRQK
jgi:hypothetical protein